MPLWWLIIPATIVLLVIVVRPAGAAARSAGRVTSADWGHRLTLHSEGWEPKPRSSRAARKVIQAARDRETVWFRYYDGSQWVEYEIEPYHCIVNENGGKRCILGRVVFPAPFDDEDPWKLFLLQRIADVRDEPTFEDPFDPVEPVTMAEGKVHTLSPFMSYRHCD